MSGLSQPNVRFADSVEKVFFIEERNFSGPLMPSARGDVRASHRFTQNHHGPSHLP
jgi:hypothetical protein